MKAVYVLALLLVSKCSATWHGGVSTQYTVLDPHSHSYSYGYADPNSQKHETRRHDGVTRGSYSYVDGRGHLQSVSYTADPHHGFHAIGTNFPKTANIGLGYDSGMGNGENHAYPQAHLILNHNGVPVDTKDVQLAKAVHAIAYSAAAAADTDAHHHLFKRSLWNYESGAHSIALTAAGVPVDNPDVQAAKEKHAAAHAAALSATVHSAASGGGYGGNYGHSHGSYHVPILTQNGVPVDTPEVQNARRTHFVALAKASAEAGSGGAHPEGTSYSTSSYHISSTGYKGPLHYPVLRNGVPVEPVEVQHARSAHLSALAAESAKSSTHRVRYGGNEY